MSIKSKPYYWVVCDYPGCTSNAQEGSEYSAWGDESTAREDADSHGDWLIDYEDKGKDYCPEHTLWDDDEDEPVPAPDTFAWQLEHAVGKAMYDARKKFYHCTQVLEYSGYQDRLLIQRRR